MLLENPTRNRVRSTRNTVVTFVRRKPYLVLFAALLSIITVIGSNQVSAAGGVVIEATPSASATPLNISKPTMYVHVVGEVLRPGLYMLESASRLADVIALAGGFTKQADPASVNLARLLTDGEQFVVLSHAAYLQIGGAASLAGVAAGGSGASRLVSLNRATQSELESLPRVGPALAGRIIDWRSVNGGFKQIHDLTKVSGFGDKMFASVKALVTL